MACPADSDPHLMRARGAALRNIAAARPGWPEAALSFWTTRPMGDALDAPFQERLTHANPRFSELFDCKTAPVGKMSSEIFGTTSNFVFISRETEQAYFTSYHVVSSFIAGVHRGIAPAAEGILLLVSRVGRLLHCAFAIEGVYIGGALREWILGIWLLPPDPTRQLTSDGQFARVPLQNVPLTMPHTPISLSSSPSAPSAVATSLLSRTSPTDPPLPCPASRLSSFAAPVSQSWFLYTPDSEKHQLVRVQARKRDCEEGLQWQCTFCYRLDTPEKRCDVLSASTSVCESGWRWPLFVYIYALSVCAYHVECAILCVRTPIGTVN